jgi:hypothetical protein
LISFARPEQIEVAAEVCQDFVIDNGAFSAWKAHLTVEWQNYYRFVEKWQRHPSCAWALIPDVIAGTEEDNDRLIAEWPHGKFGVPVWHLHESFVRLRGLCETWPRVALGSSGEWARPGARAWWARMGEALTYITDRNGRPFTKLHGLRMLSPDIYRYIPFASVDSSTIARTIGLDCRWVGQWAPPSKQVRALVLADRYEAYQSPAVWKGIPIHRRITNVTNL